MKSHDLKGCLHLRGKFVVIVRSKEMLSDKVSEMREELKSLKEKSLFVVYIQHWRRCIQWAINGDQTNHEELFCNRKKLTIECNH